VAEANCDLGQFIKDGSFEKWLEVNVSCWLIEINILLIKLI
jgi:hypothetical protein